MLLANIIDYIASKMDWKRIKCAIQIALVVYGPSVSHFYWRENS